MRKNSNSRNRRKNGIENKSKYETNNKLEAEPFGKTDIIFTVNNDDKQESQ